MTTPAFPGGVEAAKVQSVVTQAGALGDPFGSGVRTVWWVYGVGPVRIAFEHTGGETSFAQLVATSLAPRALPSDANLLPLRVGEVSRFRWRNDKHMTRWSEQRFEVAGLVNNTARVNVRDVSGPLDVLASLRLHLAAGRDDGDLDASSGASIASASVGHAAPGPDERARGAAAASSRRMT